VCLQALNVLMLKTLENSNRTYAFTALLLLTREPPPELRHRPPEAAKFFDLAVKCLIKISKALSDDLQARSRFQSCMHGKLASCFAGFQESIRVEGVSLQVAAAVRVGLCHYFCHVW
jgi:hypothetical protein